MSDEQSKVEFILEITQRKEIRVMAYPEEMERYIPGTGNDCEEMSYLWKLSGAFSSDLSAEPLKDRIYIDDREPVYELKDGMISDHPVKEGR